MCVRASGSQKPGRFCRRFLHVPIATEIFGRIHQVSAAQECARGALIFIYGLVLVRLTGRRLFGKWSALDFVVAIVLGSSLSRAMTGSAPLAGTLLACTALVALHRLVAQAAARWSIVSRIVEGRAIDLAKGGHLPPGKPLRHAISEADLNEALRGAGIEDVQDATRITLEPSGKISVLK